MKYITLALSTLLLSGCFLSDNWTQRLPADIDYEARHKDTLERRHNG
jgi:hypothetical protein